MEKDGSKIVGKIFNPSEGFSCNEGHEVVIISSSGACVCGIYLSKFAIVTLAAEELLYTFQN